MIQGIDQSNVDSRRAFPMDGRATWVESVHSGSGNHVVGKDNRVLGPGEYTPKMQAQHRKHIPGPSLGGSKGMVDHFHPFRSLLTTRTPGKSSSSKKGGSYRGGGGSVAGNSVVTWDEPSLAMGSLGGGGMSATDSYYAQAEPSYSIANDITRDTHKKEGASIFHEHDRRMAIDPHQRTTPTPGCYLNHDSLLKSTSAFSGVRDLPSTVKMGPDDIPFGERVDVRAAAPGDYRPDLCYDSKFLRKQTKLIKISPAERRTYFDLQARELEIQAGVISPVQEHKKIRQAESTTVHSDIAIQARAESQAKHDRIKSIRMPILRTRKPPTLEFDSSCYALAKKTAVDLPLNPASLRKEAKIDLFNDYLTLPRKHQGHRLTSRLTDKVKRSVF